MFVIVGVGACGENPSSRQSTRNPTPRADATTARAPMKESGAIPLEVTLSPACARPGQRVQTETRTSPHAGMTFGTTYKGDTDVSETHEVRPEDNDTGIVKWEWVIRPDLPDGPAFLSVAALMESGGNALTLEFKVSASCPE